MNLDERLIDFTRDRLTAPDRSGEQKPTLARPPGERAFCGHTEKEVRARLPPNLRNENAGLELPYSQVEKMTWMSGVRI